MSRGTSEALGVEGHHRVYVLKAGLYVRVGDYEILPFALQHDAREPLGFVIGHGHDRLLFIPDTAYVENRFADVTLVAAECNHIGEILSQNVQKGSIPSVVGQRVRRNHMSLETFVEMLRTNDLSRLREVWLIHLSSANSDELKMKKEIQELLGVPVYVA